MWCGSWAWQRTKLKWVLTKTEEWAHLTTLVSNENISADNGCIRCSFWSLQFSTLYIILRGEQKGKEQFVESCLLFLFWSCAWLHDCNVICNYPKLHSGTDCTCRILTLQLMTWLCPLWQVDLQQIYISIWSVTSILFIR